MPLEIPRLDDRTYADLVREGVALIPRYAPTWTNHNPSDPGITLLELFAYLAEIYLYRVDRISDAARVKFLELLGGDIVTEGPAARAERLRRTAAELSAPFRAVSPLDFEALALDALRGDGQGESAVQRIYCFPRRDLESRTEADRRRDRPNHVSVVFVPRDLLAPQGVLDALAQRIRRFLEPRRLLTTRVHVVAPHFVDTTIRVRIAGASPESGAALKKAVEDALNAFVTPREGGWPLGRSLYASELYRLLSGLEGVSRLSHIEFDVADRGRLLTSDDGDVVGVRVAAGELLRVRSADVAVQP